MPVAWRVTKQKYAANAFDGERARLHGGRWSSQGVPVVYVSGSLALATLEIFVNLQDDKPMSAYLSYRVEFAEELVEIIRDLPGTWSGNPSPPQTRAMGDDWIRRGTSVLLRVPSVVLPDAEEWNYLVNPAHRDFKKLRISGSSPLSLDARLVKQQE